MPANTPTVTRQMELSLQKNLLPWIEGGAPLLFFDAPPRALESMEFPETAKPPLLPQKRHKQYPHVLAWPSENLNSIDAPVLGCVFSGKTKYQVRRPPGKIGGEWIITVPEKTFFLIPPGIPFTRGFCGSDGDYARAMLIHLRRDCLHCFTYTIDHGKVWQNPYVMLHEFDAQLLAWRLLEEWRKPSLSVRIIYHYTSLILDLMLRALQQKRFTDVHGLISAPAYPQNGRARHQRDSILQFAQTYIAEHLEDSHLSCRDIALHCGISLRHLERLFKEHSGMTPAAYLNEQRLAKAKVLLQESTLPIKYVSHYCGFRQPSHFSKWFAQKTGHSPREFRSMQLRNAGNR
jgi:AraC-like DNA-binding protein